MLISDFVKHAWPLHLKESILYFCDLAFTKKHFLWLFFLCSGVNISVLRHEAEFYGITPLGG